MVAIMNGNNGLRKPTALKELAGNPGKRPLPEGEPKPPAFTPKMPTGLTKPQKKHWKQLVSMLQAGNVLTTMDEAAFFTLWSAWSKWNQADDHVRQHGVILIAADTGVPYGNPFLKTVREEFKILLRLLQEFGMTPASRAKVKTAGTASNDDDLLD